MSIATVTHDPSVRGYADTSPAKLGRRMIYLTPTGTTLIEFCGLPSMMRSV
jgi:hypothetical protein